MNAKKIAIVGIGGSGKTDFARKLSEITELPLFHMDSYFWRGNWQPVPETEYVEKQNRILVDNDRWIIEGYVDEALAERLKAADMIIYLDFGGILCALRVLKRWLNHRKQSRPELPEEALEKLDWKYLWTVLTKAERPRIESALRGVEKNKVIRLSSPHTSETFLKENTKK